MADWAREWLSVRKIGLKYRGLVFYRTRSGTKIARKPNQFSTILVKTSPCSLGDFFCSARQCPRTDQDAILARIKPLKGGGNRFLLALLRREDRGCHSGTNTNSTTEASKSYRKERKLVKEFPAI
eukprot:2103766-Amphidinium_carterae.1